MTLEADLTEAAGDEIARALTLGWKQLAAHTPWGDTFEGFTPEGREVCFERSYLWEGDPGGDIRVEVAVFEPKAYEAGVRLTRSIPRGEGGEGG
jgi:hypothetical protein